MGNVEQHPLPRERYHVVAVFNILEHLRHPDRVVERVHASLEPGGVMFGSAPNRYGLVGSVMTACGNFFDRTHVSTFPPEVWRRIFTHAGFQTIDFFGEVTLGFNRCAYIRRSGWEHLSFNLMFICTK